jgi:hypothetical protein
MKATLHEQVDMSTSIAALHVYHVTLGAEGRALCNGVFNYSLKVTDTEDIATMVLVTDKLARFKRLFLEDIHTLVAGDDMCQEYYTNIGKEAGQTEKEFYGIITSKLFEVALAYHGRATYIKLHDKSEDGNIKVLLVESND